MTNDLYTAIESMLLPKHKVFISYHHSNEQSAKDRIVREFQDQMINQSVDMGSIDPDNSTEYTRRLIRNDYVSGASVILVLCGEETATRKHVDWEVKAALDRNNNGSSGLVCVLMPSIEKYGREYALRMVPPRVKDNIDSGYAIVVSYSELLSSFRRTVHEAFQRRESRIGYIRNSRQMKVYNG